LQNVWCLFLSISGSNGHILSLPREGDFARQCRQKTKKCCAAGLKDVTQFELRRDRLKGVLPQAGFASQEIADCSSSFR
jgi:hypothetical protein